MSKKRKLSKQELHAQDLETLIKYRHIDRMTQEKAAEKMRVNVRTIKRWEASEEYGVVREDIRGDFREAVITRTHEAADKAITTLIDLLDSEHSTGHVKYEAAKAILDYIGIQRTDQVEQGDQREDLSRLTKIIQERPNQTLNVFMQPTEPGGFLPKPLQRVAEESNFLPARIPANPHAHDDILEGLIKESAIDINDISENE